MAAKTFLTTTVRNVMGGNHNSVTTSPRGLVQLQDYRRTEKPTHPNRAPYTLPMNIIAFRQPVYRAQTPPPAPRVSPEELRSRAEWQWFAYGAVMFVLGILAHMAWLSAWPPP